MEVRQVNSRVAGGSHGWQVAAYIGLELLEDIASRFSRNDESVQHPAHDGIVFVSTNCLIAWHCAEMASHFQVALTFLRRSYGYLEEPHSFFAISPAIALGNVAGYRKTRSPDLIPQHPVAAIIATFSQAIDSLRQFVGQSKNA